MATHEDHNTLDEGQNSSSAQRIGKFPPFVDEAIEQYFTVRVNQSWHGKHILKGKIPAADALIFSSNDYLHISQHPKLIEAQIAALRKYGNGQMQSPVFLREDTLLSACEQQFAQFLGYPAALLAQSGWCANIGLIQALASRNLPIYLDFYAHMSFWEGVKAANAKPIPFRHNSVHSLRKRLERYGSGIIAVDSIYSSTGTISPLLDYVQLAKEFNCLLIVDESHSLGTHGAKGCGLVAELGLSDQVDIVTASLAKAFSGRGGLIAASNELIELVRYTSLPIIFSSALVPHDLEGFCASLSIIANEEWRRRKLHDNALFLRNHLLKLGFYLGGSNSQIIPLITGSEANTIWLRNALEKEDIYGAVFCAPATPKNNALIRLSISANHSQENLIKVIDCLAKLDRKKHPLPLFAGYLEDQ
ncbi:MULTISPECIES: alpha-hydroxyketone-type quorum-sensing autoinducer synthase [Legionella]|uniref:Aminotransferase class II n=1 Tax=Legionella maceachernii TaxID=466 RepID=A0A0W0VZ88_9GAMM|nr:alpha-hydroxyketone-type quorum-sensing autoinducer synthase [Legionella maceachernii]KTD25504.1 aminotransferase class II [Legionella maceachernii]SJZ54644.1 7-keto-8-aminopelargonate synthetase [Legionella maceachernii]SUP00365.1 CAI-1 autoinducer synthase [Legionella maceachernii]